MSEPKEWSGKAIKDIGARHEIHNWLAQTRHDQRVEKRRRVVTYKNSSSKTTFARTHLFCASKKQAKTKAQSEPKNKIQGPHAAKLPILDNFALK
jgi:hypothetical protein